MIPHEKSEAVTRGLREAFGVSEFEDISQLTKGHTTSLVFRIVVGGAPYLLKVILRTDDPTRHYACMRAAADAGLAPRVRYTNVEDKVSITDFVEAVPFSVADALTRVPATLRALHALPPFARVPDHLNTSYMFLMNKGPAVDGFVQRFQSLNLMPQDETDQVFARYAQMAAVYPHDEPDMVSSHNDLFKPDNLLFDGQRVWLVDWEAAFLNDCYADLAVMANLVVTNEAEARVYLQQYFGESPDEYQLARFFLAQQVAHLFYAMAYLLFGSAGEPVDLSESAPDFRDFHRRIWAGEVNLADQPMKIAYGRIHWERLLHSTRHARFDEALKIISAQGYQDCEGGDNATAASVVSTRKTNVS